MHSCLKDLLYRVLLQFHEHDLGNPQWTLPGHADKLKGIVLLISRGKAETSSSLQIYIYTLSPLHTGTVFSEMLYILSQSFLPDQN